MTTFIIENIIENVLCGIFMAHNSFQNYPSTSKQCESPLKNKIQWNYKNPKKSKKKQMNIFSTIP